MNIRMKSVIILMICLVMSLNTQIYVCSAASTSSKTVSDTQTFQIDQSVRIKQIYNDPINPDQTSKNPLYRIVINTATQQVAVFINNEKATMPKYVFSCSTGIYNNTFKGTYKTSDYYEWRQMLGGVYARYAVRFNGNELIHSVPYTRRSPDSLEYREFNLLGQPASLGCCRMAVSDVKWIYEHTVPGTRVDVIEDEETVYKQTYENILIDENDTEKRGWDPTDFDEDSPWTWNR